MLPSGLVRQTAGARDGGCLVPPAGLVLDLDDDGGGARPRGARRRRRRCLQPAAWCSTSGRSTTTAAGALVPPAAGGGHEGAAERSTSGRSTTTTTTAVPPAAWCLATRSRERSGGAAWVLDDDGGGCPGASSGLVLDVGGDDGGGASSGLVLELGPLDDDDDDGGASSGLVLDDDGGAIAAATATVSARARRLDLGAWCLVLDDVSARLQRPGASSQRPGARPRAARRRRRRVPWCLQLPAAATREPLSARPRAARRRRRRRRCLQRPGAWPRGAVSARAGRPGCSTTTAAGALVPPAAWCSTSGATTAAVPPAAWCSNSGRSTTTTTTAVPPAAWCLASGRSPPATRSRERSGGAAWVLDDDGGASSGLVLDDDGGAIAAATATVSARARRLDLGAWCLVLDDVSARLQRPGASSGLVLDLGALDDDGRGCLVPRPRRDRRRPRGAVSARARRLDLGALDRGGSTAAGLVGLSPRVRGNCLGQAALFALGRAIPACAGELISGCSTATAWWGYPRVCGGTSTSGAGAWCLVGLSPRVRGNCARIAAGAGELRAIPACAGELCAGPQRWSWLAAGYPRVCGGTGVVPSGLAPVTGLSPRVRGNSTGSALEQGSCGAIPACAGELGTEAALERPRWGYPRVCGGTRITGRYQRAGRGLSPRVRGVLSGRPATRRRLRAIPACAGSARAGGALRRRSRRGCCRRGSSTSGRSTTTAVPPAAWCLTSGATTTTTAAGALVPPAAWCSTSGATTAAVPPAAWCSNSGRSTTTTTTAVPPAAWCLASGRSPPATRSRERSGGAAWVLDDDGGASSGLVLDDDGGAIAAATATVSARARRLDLGAWCLVLDDVSARLQRPGASSGLVLDLGALDDDGRGCLVPRPRRDRRRPRGAVSARARRLDLGALDRGGSTAAGLVGLSPRVRGNCLGQAALFALGRAIPACAGELISGCSTATAWWGYPRVCGGTSTSGAGAWCLVGLSPRVRGNCARIAAGAGELRAIPACAGELCAGPQRWSWLAAGYPRVCGGTGVVPSGLAPVTGLSPRVRGNSTGSALEQGSCGAIPACAGELRRLIDGPKGTRGYPRVCGGTSRDRMAACTPGGLSPRVRGNSDHRTLPESGEGAIPACAGSAVRPACYAAAPSGYPRVCGEC